MTTRARFTAAILGSFALALGLELWAAFDRNPDTPTLTELIITYVPAAIGLAAVQVFAVWLVWHFRQQRWRRTSVDQSSLAAPWQPERFAQLADATIELSGIWDGGEPTCPMIVQVLRGDPSVKVDVAYAKGTLRYTFDAEEARLYGDALHAAADKIDPAGARDA